MEKFIIVPLVALIGMYVTGKVMEALFGVPYWALFAAAGGVGAFAAYFKLRMAQ